MNTSCSARCIHTSISKLDMLSPQVLLACDGEGGTEGGRVERIEQQASCLVAKQAVEFLHILASLLKGRG